MMLKGGLGTQVEQLMEAGRANPQALQTPGFAGQPELLRVLAMQQLKNEKEAAMRQKQMQAQQAPGTVVEQLDKQLLDMTEAEMAEKMGMSNPALPPGQPPQMRPPGPQGPQMRPPSPQGPQGAPQGGLASIPMPPMKTMASGGIVSFAEGGYVEEPSMLEKVKAYLRSIDDEFMGPERAAEARKRVQGAREKGGTAATLGTGLREGLSGAYDWLMEPVEIVTEATDNVTDFGKALMFGEVGDEDEIKPKEEPIPEPAATPVQTGPAPIETAIPDYIAEEKEEGMFDDQFWQTLADFGQGAAMTNNRNLGAVLTSGAQNMNAQANARSEQANAQKALENERLGLMNKQEIELYKIAQKDRKLGNDELMNALEQSAQIDNQLAQLKQQFMHEAGIDAEDMNTPEAATYFNTWLESNHASLLQSKALVDAQKLRRITEMSNVEVEE